MEAPGISLEEYMSAQNNAAILAIVPDGPQAAEVERLFAHSNWLLQRASTRKEASAFLQQNHISVVLTAAKLPDGGWREVLSDTEKLADPPRLIVMASHDKFLWGEVINCGGYDVLETPLDRRELFTVLNFAWSRARSVHNSGSTLVATA